MKKKLFLIILCILFIPFIVHAEEEKVEKEYIFEKVDINVSIDEEKKQLIVNEKILTGDVDEELTVGRIYDNTSPTGTILLKEFPCKLKSNTEYSYSYVIDSSDNNDVVKYNFLYFHVATIEENYQLIRNYSYSFKYKKITINISNTNEDDIKKVLVYSRNPYFSHQEYDKYIKIESIGEIETSDIAKDTILFEKDFGEDPPPPKKEVSSFEIMLYILIISTLLSTIYLIIITSFKKIKIDELNLDTDIKKWYEEKRSSYDIESFGFAVPMVIASIMFPIFLPYVYNSIFKEASIDSFFDALFQQYTATNMIALVFLSIALVILLSRCYYNTRLLSLNKVIRSAKIMKLTSYNMTKKINQESADTYTITAHINGIEYKKKGTYKNYLNYDNPHIVLYRNNKYDIFFKQ